MADRTTIILHSGEMDKLYSALIIGTGALSMGMESTIYFTFWGLQRLKKGGLEKGKLSKMNMMEWGNRWSREG
jgi:peroxiredoxin family protein